MKNLFLESKKHRLPVLCLGENFPLQLGIEKLRQALADVPFAPTTSEPWLPLYFLAGIPVFFHYRGANDDFWGLPFGFRILLPEADYRRSLSAIFSKISFEKQTFAFEAPENFAELAEFVERIGFYKLDARTQKGNLANNKYFRFYGNALLNGENALPLEWISAKENLLPTEIARNFRAFGYKRLENCVYVLTSQVNRIQRLYENYNAHHREEEIVFFRACAVLDEELNDIGASSEKVTRIGTQELRTDERGNNLFDCNAVKAQKIEDCGQENIEEILAVVLKDAFKKGASDVHIQTLKEGGVVRFRIHNFLSQRLELNASLQRRLNNVLLRYGGMDTTNLLDPQSGRFSAIFQEKNFDLRVSMIPESNGQSSCVLRIHDEKGNIQKLSDLGFSPMQDSLFRESLDRKSGIILVTGPTGSGKSTTLYSALTEINSPEIAIETIEDPIERRIEGLKQFQVRYNERDKSKDLSFSKIFREVLRHDPDVILVGEIRDAETAQLAIEAAQTGHLVLSTLHTQDALGSIPRLLTKGIPVEFLADSLLLLQAQRLVGTLCKNCRKPLTGKKLENALSLLKAHSLEEIDENLLFEAGKCDFCNQTGYAGKQAIFEVVPVTELLRQMISEKATIQAIRKKLEGLETLLDSGLKAFSRGETSIEEILKYSRQFSIEGGLN